MTVPKSSANLTAILILGFSTMRITKIVLFILLVFTLSACGKNPLVSPISDLPQPQQAESYITDPRSQAPLMTKQAQMAEADQYRQKFFSPWDKNRDFRYFDRKKRISIAREQNKTLRSLVTRKNYGANFHVLSSDWINNIASNMGMSSFPNTNLSAIIVHNTPLRALPTLEPAFNNYNLPGEGFPFDNLQYQALWVGTPVHVSHISRDGAWALVVASTMYGWVNINDLAYVNPKFIKQWRKAPLVAITKNHTSVHDQNGKFRFDGRIGMLLPRNKSGVLIPVADMNNNAVIRTARISPSAYVNFPTPITKQRFVQLINELLGEPYGWGGLYGYRDCSQTLMDIYTPFGIWLPRNSRAQLSTRPHVDLRSMSKKEKQEYIAKHGKPLLSLIGLPGHVTLYIGQKNNLGYVFHDFWGLRTKDIFQNVGRGVVGQTVITPVTFGSGIPNVDYTLIEAVTTMTYMDSPIS